MFLNHLGTTLCRPPEPDSLASAYKGTYVLISSRSLELASLTMTDISKGHTSWCKPLDASLYNPDEEETTFLKQTIAIDDDDELRRHILSLQERAFSVRSSLSLGSLQSVSPCHTSCTAILVSVGSTLPSETLFARR